jgi:glycosidase
MNVFPFLFVAGITEKLDYLVDIGVNAIWLTPFLESPLESGGYDVSDYLKVQDVFGSMEDFENLVNTAHKKSTYDNDMNHIIRIMNLTVSHLKILLSKIIYIYI